MIQPERQPHTLTRRYNGVKEAHARSWDRNKARIESIYQLPTRDFRQTEARFGDPPSITSTVTERGLPKMECTTTTKSDFCQPSLKRYLTVPGICPDKEYPSSTGLDYCPEKPHEKEPPPVAFKTRSTYPVTSSLQNPNTGAAYLGHKEYEIREPNRCSKNGPLTIPNEVNKPSGSQVAYSHNLNHLANQSNSQALISHQTSSSDMTEPKGHTKEQFDSGRTSVRLPNADVTEGTIRTRLDYTVETKDHAEKRKLHDSNMAKARLEYERMVGSPGATVPLIKAGVDPPDAVAHYNVPDYTQGTKAGGMVKPRFGAPNVEMKIPITDPSYPQPEKGIPPPEPGLTKITYSQINDGGLNPKAYDRDDVYKTSQGQMQIENVEITHPSPLTAEGASPGQCGPSIIELQGGEIAGQPPPESPNSDTAHPGDNSGAGKHLPTIKNWRRIQTTNQIYGSWIDDPYLKGNDWWFKAKGRMPLQKTYISKYEEEKKMTM